MKHNPLYTVLIASAVTLYSSAAFAQADLQEKINSAAAYTSSRPRADVASTMRSAGLAAVPEDFSLLKLAPGFLVDVRLDSDAYSQINGSYRIDQRGDIKLPGLSPLHVAGETALEAGEQVANQLESARLFKKPQLTLSILEYSAPEVAISGEVATPGKYPLLAPRRLSEVLALAGGTTMLAAGDVDITHSEHPETPTLAHYVRGGEPSRNNDVIVYPGDSVMVRRAGVVYVLGAVTRPGGYVMQENGSLNVLQAVSLANGTIFTSSLNTVYVLRQNPDGTQVNIPLAYKKIVAGKEPNVLLHAADVLYVPTSGAKSFLQNTQGIVAATASASIYGAVR